MSINDRKLVDVLKYDMVKGEVGIEIEAEAKGNRYFPQKIPNNYWSAVGDGSLRGICIEYVLKKPLSFEKANEALDVLQKAIIDEEVDMVYSFRAGTHIHLNCLDMTIGQILVLSSLYMSLENLLVEWCGNDRVGNHFCLRVKDAEGLLPFVARCFRDPICFTQLFSDDIRYASINFSSLIKYGSLEFRAMATEPDFNRIKTWIGILRRLQEKSKNIGSIEALLEEFSMGNPRDWVKEILGDYYEEVKDQDNFDIKIWRGVRSAQDFLFYLL